MNQERSSDADTSTNISTAFERSNPQLSEPVPPSSQSQPCSEPDPKFSDPELMFRSILDQLDGAGRTAIYIAVQTNRPKTVETLLAFKADPNICDPKNVSPLQIACDSGFETVIRVLARSESTRCAGVKIESTWNSIPDHDQRADIIAYLVSKGATFSRTFFDERVSQMNPYYQFVFEEALKGNCVR